jgi:hypothetical protein
MSDNPLLMLILSFIGAGGGAYFGSYLKKKGENVATHEDLDKLVIQMAAVTQTTKQIEAKISNDVWDRQKRWEVKRDSLLEMMRAFSRCSECLQRLFSTYEATPEHGKGETAWLERKAEATDAWQVSWPNLSMAVMIAELVCGHEVKELMKALHTQICLVAQYILSGTPAVYSKYLPSMVGMQMELVTAVRAELGMAPLDVTPQSSGWA